MKKYIIAAVVGISLVISPPVNAEEVIENTQSSETISDTIPEPSPDPVEDLRQYPNVDTLPPPSQELVQQDPWTNSSNAPVGQTPSGQDEPESWAVVDENGNTLNIIVCDVDFCGSGWIPTAYDGFTPTQWSRVVLQGARDPETGISNGGHWGQYNFPSNVWTEDRRDRGTYQIPVEFGQQPFCIANCPVLEEDVIESPPVPEGEEEIITQTTGVFINSEPRSFNVVIQTNKKEFSFNKKFPIRKSIKNGNVWVVATNGKEKSVWKFKVAKRNKTNITLPIKYSDWNLSINYVLKNNKKVSSRIFLV